MATCDLCNSPAGADSTRRTCAEFRAAVKAGLRPPPGMFGLGAAFGLSPQVAEAGWVQQVMSDTTDWVLCAECTERTKRFFASGHPAAGCLLAIILPLLGTGAATWWWVA